MSYWSETGLCGRCKKPAPIPVEHKCEPELAYTLAQVKEIIEGIAVRVEDSAKWYSDGSQRFLFDTDVILEIANSAKIVREFMP